MQIRVLEERRAAMSSLSGSGVEPRPKTYLEHFGAPETVSVYIKFRVG